MYQDIHAIKKAVSDLRMDVENLPYPVNTQREAISSFIEQIAKEHGLTKEEVELRRRISEDLEAHLKATLPDVRLTRHGSSVKGFGLKTSNVDMDLSPIRKADAFPIFRRKAFHLNERPVSAMPQAYERAEGLLVQGATGTLQGFWQQDCLRDQPQQLQLAQDLETP